MVIMRYPFWATPLEQDELAGLIPTHIHLQSELDEWETLNIMRGREWGVNFKRQEALSEAFILTLHRKMFDETWRWAGNFRRSNKNIGVDWRSVPTSFRDAIADAIFWEGNHIFPIRELAVRFHHRLVQIHPFSNGNGRHARMIADILLIRHKEAPLRWDRLDRKEYIKALREADDGNFQSLNTLLL